MHKTFKQGHFAPGIWIVIATIFAFTTTLAQEQEEKNPFSLDIIWNTYSAYVWRGKVLDKGGVTQPSAIVTYKTQEYGSFSMKVWSNWDISQNQSNSKATKPNGGLNVLNFTPSYSKDFGPAGFTIGNIWYTFYPRTVNSTRELFAILAYKNSIVTPSLSLYYDYWEVGGGFLEENPAKDLYTRVALDKTIPLSDRFSLKGTALVGAGGRHFNEIRYRSSKNEGLADYQLSTCLSYAINDNLSVGGTLALTGLFSGAAGLDRTKMSPDEIFWGGINLRCVF